MNASLFVLVVMLLCMKLFSVIIFCHCTCHIFNDHELSHTTIGIIRPKRGIGTQCYTFHGHEYINERTVEEGFR